MPMAPEDIARILVRDRDRYIAGIWGVVRDFDLAEDLFQDVCADAVSKRGQIDDADHLANWVRRAGRFRAIDALRRRQTNPLVFDTDVLAMIDDQWTDPPHEHAQRAKRALRACVGELTDNARRIIQLRYGQDVKGNDLAKRLGKKPNAVFVALTRIHQTLGACIELRLRGEAVADD